MKGAGGLHSVSETFISELVGLTPSPAAMCLRRSPLQLGTERSFIASAVIQIEPYSL